MAAVRMRKDAAGRRAVVDDDPLLPLSSLTQLAEMPPGRMGRSRMHQKSVYYWHRRGIGGTRLRVEKRGTLLFTRLSWLQEFLAAVQNGGAR